MKAKLFAAALLLAAVPAQADIISVGVGGRITDFTGAYDGVQTGGVFTAHAMRFDTSIGALTGQSWQSTVTNCNCSGQLIGGQLGEFPVLIDSFYGVMFSNTTSVLTWGSGLVSLDITGPFGYHFAFSQLTGVGDFQLGSCDERPCGSFDVRGVGTSVIEISPVPGPTVGAGLPGLMMLLALWQRWRRCARSC